MLVTIFVSMRRMVHEVMFALCFGVVLTFRQWKQSSVNHIVSSHSNPSPRVARHSHLQRDSAFVNSSVHPRPISQHVLADFDLSLLAFCRIFVIAAPASVQPESIVTLDEAQLERFIPYAQFARAAYCHSSALDDWKCGQACSAVGDFQVSLVGGDGDAIPIYFVGYWPSKNTVVVAHEGTDPTKLLSVLTDADAFFGDLDWGLFPGIPDGIQVHRGFRDAHVKTISAISEEVHKLLSTTGADSVTCIGHSLGGALAQLDSLYFSLHIPSVTINAITFGIPRVGNAVYASFYDVKVPNFQRINNKRDPIPIVPGQDLGYRHPHGEIHILEPGSGVACSGDDDDVDRQCQDLYVMSVIFGNILDHLGPYEGVPIGTIFCT